MSWAADLVLPRPSSTTSPYSRFEDSHMNVCARSKTRSPFSQQALVLVWVIFWAWAFAGSQPISWCQWPRLKLRALSEVSRARMGLNRSGTDRHSPP